MPTNGFMPIPAIDLMDGQVVRLKRGEAGLKTVYSDDPVTMAMRFEDAGAKRLHIVDLDGAFEGRPRNYEALAHIRLSVRMEIEVGGGLRKAEDIARLFDIGVNYAILGTSALQDRTLVSELVELHDDRIIVGIDCKDGKVAVKGWVETSDVSQLDFAQKLQDIGVSTIIATDIATDGMMQGPNLQNLVLLAQSAKVNIIASGGVRNLEDLKDIHSLGQSNIIGAIVGRAIYDGQLNLREAIAAFS